MEKIMTIIYNKRNLNIKAIADGSLGLESLGLDLEEAELLYNRIELPYNRYVVYHVGEFYLDNSNGNIEIKLKDEYREQVKQFL